MPKLTMMGGDLVTDTQGRKLGAEIRRFSAVTMGGHYATVSGFPMYEKENQIRQTSIFLQKSFPDTFFTVDIAKN